MIERLKLLLTNPTAYWKEAVTQPGDIKSQLVPTMALLAGIPALLGFVGQMITLMRTNPMSALLAGLVTAALVFVLQVAIWVSLGFVIDALASTFGAERDIGQSMKLASGTIIPMWLGLALNVLPMYLGMLGWLAGLGYGAYMLYVGLPIMNQTAPEKAIGYTAAVIGILLALSLAAVFVAGCPAACMAVSAIRSTLSSY
jgi:hypothetical protein